MAVTFQVTGVGTPNSTFALSVVGSAISVQVATDGTGTATTTIHTVYNALVASPAVTALVTPSGVEADPSELFLTNYGPANVAPVLMVIILGEVLCFTLTAFSAITPGAQLAFYGVRRIQGGYSDPAPSTYPYYEKVFQIPFTFTIAGSYNPALPFLAQGARLLVPILDYDFELRHITKYSHDANNVVISYPSPFAIILYDSTYVARMNAPLMAELLCDDLVTPNGRNFWPSPPIMYKTNSHIPMDIFSMVEPGIALPVTVTLLFDGVRRIPCV